MIAVLAPLRTLVSSLLIIQGNIQPSDDFFPCSQCLCQLFSWLGEYEGFHSAFIMQPNVPPRGAGGISADGTGQPGRGRAQEEGECGGRGE